MRWSTAILLFACVHLSGFKTGSFGSVNIQYDFESREIDSGPDTFEIFAQSSSNVSLSMEYAYRGRSSLHIQDFRKNQSFPEFQGYFPTVSRGVVYIGFALMTPNPEERFNIAFAGDKHFQLAPNGFGFWLLNDHGTLRHVSDSIPKRLFKLDPFQWYWFEIELDVSAGDYSLNVTDEFGAEVVSLSKQAHPMNAKGSNLVKYSFAGDLSDQGGANFFIDEFVLRTDYADSPKELVAPGRRSLFVDQWNDYHKRAQTLDFCLAPKLPYDFIDVYNVDGLQVLQKNVAVLRSLLASPSSEYLAEFKHDEDLINGVAKWAEGCLLLKNKQYDEAIDRLEKASHLIGNAPAVHLAEALAYANNGQYFIAHSIVNHAHIQWPDDIRWEVVMAALGFMSGQIENSEQVLTYVANTLQRDKHLANSLMENLGWLTSLATTNLKSQFVFDEKAKAFIVAEQYYYSLLWQDRFDDAEHYARKFIRLLDWHGYESPIWFERAGDAALLGNRLSSADKHYLYALTLEPERLSTLQKLADVYFLQGRAEDERQLRESIFGVLDFE